MTGTRTRTLLAAATVAAFALALLGAGCGSAGPAQCDGLASICGKRLDQVVFPGTHNAFAASDEPGWHFANQQFGIGRQLDDGIRALLIDVHYGIADPSRDLVRTDFAAEGADGNKALQAAPEEAKRVAIRLAGPLGVGLPPGTPSLYLCHALCELGAEPLADELGVIARYLRAHRRVFLIVIVEDYVPPEAIEQAFTQAGLAKLAVTLRLGSPLPTVGALLDEGRQLAVFSEDHGGSPAWYMPAFTYIQDTPLGANLPTQLSCDRARGNADSPLLLINHWIPPFPPSARINAEIGRAAFLRRRVERCMRERDREGAIVAVDFYNRGSVVEVAHDLNDG